MATRMTEGGGRGGAAGSMGSKIKTKVGTAVVRATTGKKSAATYKTQSMSDAKKLAETKAAVKAAAKKKPLAEPKSGVKVIPSREELAKKVASETRASGKKRLFPASTTASRRLNRSDNLDPHLNMGSATAKARAAAAARAEREARGF